jgi:hypothetical protein
MGKFDMSAPASGPMALLKKLRGKPETADNGADNGAKAHRRRPADEDAAPLPKILRFIPGTAQDVRAYFLTLQYWLAGSRQNIANMVHYLVDRYADGPRAACAAGQAARAGGIPGGRRLPPAHAAEAAAPVRHERGRPAASLATRASAARWACCCCARTCWPATPATTTA